MAATAMASSSLHLACPCSCSSSESRLLPRHGLASLFPCMPSPLKLACNGSRLSMSAYGGNPKVLVEVSDASSIAGSKNDLGLAWPAALAVLAAAVVPEMAEAVAPGVSPSLKNLLLSVVAGGVVLVAIGGAVAAVSTFDPVKRK